MQQSQRPFEPTAEDYAHSRLVSYAAYQWPAYRDAAHHRLIARALERVERGETKRLMIFMPPRHGKSMLASEFFPAWYLGRNPDHYVIAATYSQDLADDFGRKVRNQIADPSFGAIFPGVLLKDDSSSVKRFHVDGPKDALTIGQSGAYFAVGVGGPLTGRGAHLLLIDDPVKNREEADSETTRRRTRDWYTSTAYTRLMPGGRVVVIQCMTGDTMVMLPDGQERPLRDIRQGDRIATWDDGVLGTSVVQKWRSNGLDNVFAIKTSSGIVVKANERHPFLVLVYSDVKWIRTKDLRPGHAIFRVNGASGRAKVAATKAAISQSRLAGIVRLITTKSDGLTVFARRLSTLSLDAMRICATATASQLSTLTGFLKSKVMCAQFADSPRAKTSAPIGAGSFASIIATALKKSEGFFATIATSQSATLNRQKPPRPLQDTSDFILDEVVEISFGGVDEVFDVQIDRTENFIANGLVSHNTRWHEDDLAGWLIRDHGHEGWEVLDLPAISDDGKPLWPEQYDLTTLEGIRRALPPRDWSALYQQRPTPDTGDYFQADWLKPVIELPPRSSMRIYGGSDYAVTADGGDYTVHVVVGVDPDGKLWLLDLWRGQAASDAWIEAFCDLVNKWKPLEWAEETGQIRAGVGPFLDRRMRERSAFVKRTQFPTRGDKAVRAQSIRGRMAMDGLCVPAGAAWRNDFVSELMRFPAGVHDDQVDALGLVGQLLDKMVSGSRPDPNAPPKPKSGYGARDRNSGHSALTL